MGFASLIGQKPVRTRFQDQKGTADLMLLDVTITDTSTYESDITENPVEDGIDVNDHVRPKPVMLTIDGYVSDTPLTLGDEVSNLKTTDFLKNLEGGFASSAGAIVGNQLGGKYASTVSAVAGGQLGAALTQSGDLSNGAQIARDTLESFQKNKIILTLVTKRRVYTNMCVQSLTFPRDSSTGQGLKFTCRLKQLNIVTSQDVLIQVIAKKSAHTAVKQKDKGNQSTTPVATGPDKTIAKGLSDKFFPSLFGGK
jgi:hypothetical protein